MMHGMWILMWIMLHREPQLPPVWLDDKFMDCIRHIESGGDPNAVSKKGAVGPYQFMPETFKEVSGGMPIEGAKNESVSRAFAKGYFRKIYNTLERWKGEPPSMQDCVMAYNCGMTGLKRAGYKYENVPKETQKYWLKFEDCYGEVK